MYFNLANVNGVDQDLQSDLYNDRYFLTSGSQAIYGAGLPCAADHDVNDDPACCPQSGLATC